MNLRVIIQKKEEHVEIIIIMDELMREMIQSNIRLN